MTYLTQCLSLSIFDPHFLECTTAKESRDLLNVIIVFCIPEVQLWMCHVVISHILHMMTDYETPALSYITHDDRLWDTSCLLVILHLFFTFSRVACGIFQPVLIPRLHILTLLTFRLHPMHMAPFSVNETQIYMGQKAPPSGLTLTLPQT